MEKVWKVLSVIAYYGVLLFWMGVVAVGSEAFFYVFTGAPFTVDVRAVLGALDLAGWAALLLALIALWRWKLHQANWGTFAVTLWSLHVGFAYWALRAVLAESFVGGIIWSAASAACFIAALWTMWRNFTHVSALAKAVADAKKRKRLQK